MQIKKTELVGKTEETAKFKGANGKKIMDVFFELAVPLSPTDPQEIEIAMRERFGVPQEEIEKLKKHLNGQND